MKYINQLSNRNAMGLPEHYIRLTYEQNTRLYDELIIKSQSELVEILQTSTELSRRICAGNILALIGDPRINTLKPTMTTLPAAEICIGSNMSEIKKTADRYAELGVTLKWFLKEFPKHTVKIKTFNIAKYPVTNREYLDYLQDSPNAIPPRAWHLGCFDESKSNHPVHGLTVIEADNYAKWLSEKTQRKFRLPTEYEWEYAASGPEHSSFPWGEQYKNTHDLANTIETGLVRTTPVGCFPNGASYFGCMDMAGNVEEFVSDTYFRYPNGFSIRDDLGSEHSYHIARGGSFARFIDLANTRRRHGYFNKAIYVIGFRLAESLS